MLKKLRYKKKNTCNQENSSRVKYKYQFVITQSW